jgi:hypothetical protein
VLVVVAAVLVLVAGGATLAFRPFGLLARVGSGAAPYEPGGVVYPVSFPVSGVTYAKLAAVSATSSRAAWIIGSVAWRWDGSRWENEPLPKVGNFELDSVASLGRADAWAVGSRDSDTRIQSQALVEHWDGLRWSVAGLPSLHTSVLLAVSGSGPGNVWAAGATFRGRRLGRVSDRGTRPLLLHWDGASWRRVSIPWARPGLELDKVVATGPSNVWVVSTGSQGNGKTAVGPIAVEHWNGTRWRSVSAPFGSRDSIAGFSATAWDDAWAVGSYRQRGSASYSHPLAAHWDGEQWRVEPVPNRPGQNSAALADITVLRPDDAWAIGQSQRVAWRHDGGSVWAPVALLEHWDGRSWSIMPGVAPVSWWATSITATNDGSAWATGDCGYNTFVARWTNGAWGISPHPRDVHWRSGVPARLRRGRLPSCSSAAAAG